MRTIGENPTEDPSEVLGEDSSEAHFIKILVRTPVRTCEDSSNDHFLKSCVRSTVRTPVRTSL